MRWCHTPHMADRLRVEFAWTPTRCEDGVTYWLESIRVRQYYYQGMGWVTVFRYGPA